MSAEAVRALAAEFDRLADAGKQVGFWWRDDDAVAGSPALDRLLVVTEAVERSVSLAVIPERAEISLADRVRGEDGVTILVHGWRHANHANEHERKAEFGPHRAIRNMVEEAHSGQGRISDLFGTRALPVFVPPWNRIAPDFAAQLPAIGYRALSCFGEPEGAGGIARIDTHLDPVDWRGTRSLAEPEALVAMTRRAITRGADAIGFLTHHLVFDEALWSFSERMAELAGDHPAIRPLGLGDLIGRPHIVIGELAEAGP